MIVHSSSTASLTCSAKHVDTISAIVIDSTARTFNTGSTSYRGLQVLLAIGQLTSFTGAMLSLSEGCAE